MKEHRRKPTRSHEGLTWSLFRSLGAVALLLTSCVDTDSDEVVRKATAVPVMQYRPDPGQSEDRARAFLIREVRSACNGSQNENVAILLTMAATLEAREGYWEAVVGSTPTIDRKGEVVTARVYPDGLATGDFMAFVMLICAAR